MQAFYFLLFPETDFSLSEFIFLNFQSANPNILSGTLAISGKSL